MRQGREALKASITGLWIEDPTCKTTGTPKSEVREMQDTRRREANRRGAAIWPFPEAILPQLPS